MCFLVDCSVGYGVGEPSIRSTGRGKNRRQWDALAMECLACLAACPRLTLRSSFFFFNPVILYFGREAFLLGPTNQHTWHMRGVCVVCVVCVVCGGVCVRACGVCVWKKGGGWVVCEKEGFFSRFLELLGVRGG